MRSRQAGKRAEIKTPKPKTEEPRAEKSTQEQFLDAAEMLFARHGFEGTSIRAIAEEAGVNLGTLHYYWGSKKALFHAVLERRLRPVMEERLRRFDECLMRSENGVPDVREVLEAAISPALTASEEDEVTAPKFGDLLARALTDPSPEVVEAVDDVLNEASLRQIRLLRQCCQHLDDQAFYWRLHGVFGAPQLAYSSRNRIVRLSRGAFKADDIERGVQELVQFIVAGLMAPALAEPEGQKSAAAKSRKQGSRVTSS